MSIRIEARQWLFSNHKNVSGPIYTSKYYTPEQSWPKTRVWWFQIPLKLIDRDSKGFINLVCQVAPNENDFHYLKVPVKYFYENRQDFILSLKRSVCIYPLKNLSYLLKNAVTVI